LEGLDITELKLSEVRRDNEKLRIDDTFFNKLAVLTQRRVEAMSHARLGDITSVVRKGIFDINADAYTETGIPFVRITNLRSGLISTADLAHIPPSIHAAENKTALFRGDIVLSKTAYAAAAWVNLKECNTSQDTVAVRLSTGGQKKLRAGAVVAFLNSRHGLALMWRYFQGNVQAHLSLPDARKLPIPIFAASLQESLEKLLIDADRLMGEAGVHLATADHVLLRALGLDDWRPPQPLSYVRRASEVAAAARFDAEFFAPRTRQLLAKLGVGGLSIRDVAPPRHEDFRGAGGPGEFDYIEIGALRGDGTVDAERLPCAEAPSRAAWHVRAGDVVTSTVRPNRRLSALIVPEQDGYIASSGFVVLQPDAVSAEVLLTYLRLPPVCEVMDLHASASLYPAISETDLLKLPFPKLNAKVCDEVTSAMRAAHAARREAQTLLVNAQHAVELAIEQGEPDAKRFLK
jgi:type I restriction enzyme S subunit